MANKTKLLFFIIVSVQAFACTRQVECFQPEILMRYDVTPHAKTYKIGDSIRFKLEIDRFNTDIDDGRPVDVTTFDLYDKNITFTKLNPPDNRAENIVGWRYFQTKTLRGSFIREGNWRVRLYKLERVDDKFMLELLLIPLEKGAFVFFTSEGFGRRRTRSNCDLLFIYRQPLFANNNHEIKFETTGHPAIYKDTIYPYWFYVQ